MKLHKIGLAILVSISLASCNVLSGVGGGEAEKPFDEFDLLRLRIMERMANVKAHES